MTGRGGAALLAAAAAGVLAVWFSLALTGMASWQGTNHVSGAWAALALNLLERGELYPPLFDGEAYGGTRFAPLTVALHAGTAAVTGEYLVSGRAVALASLLALAAALWWTLRRGGASCSTALAAVALVLVSGPAMINLEVRGDALAVALQLVALGLVWPPAADARTLDIEPV